MIALPSFIFSVTAMGMDVPIPDIVPELTEVPETRDASQSCVCPARSIADVTFTGYVIDAKVILGADRRSVEDRMATIFDVKYSDDSKIHDRTPVWHNVSEEFCGITFDYGKKYQVHARWGDNGELETDQCLMGE
jgi:hypothetical protein